MLIRGSILRRQLGPSVGKLTSRPIQCNYTTNCDQDRSSSHTSKSSSTDNDPLLSSASPKNHNSLSTFLSYAARTNLSPTSTTYLGTHYEYTVLNSLTRFGLSLTHVGGSSDHGIDLLGTWSLSLPSQSPSSPSTSSSVLSTTQTITIPTLIQCKSLSRGPSPSLIRELEGAFAGAPAGYRSSEVIALLVTTKEATKGVREAVGRSRWPMGFVMCDRQGRIGQMVWNRRAEEVGLLGVGVGIRYFGGEKGDGTGEKEVFLTWRGQALMN